MTYSHLKIGSIIFSLLFSVTTFAQMLPQEAPGGGTLVPEATAPTTIQNQAVGTKTNVFVPTAATANTVTTTQLVDQQATTATKQTFFQKIYTPIVTLFYTVTDALGITRKTTRDTAAEINRETRAGNPGRHARVYTNQTIGGIINSGSESNASNTTRGTASATQAPLIR